MKFRLGLMHRLTVPLAAVAGFGASQLWPQRQPLAGDELTAAVAAGEAERGVRTPEPATRGGQDSLTNPASGTVKKWADRLRNCRVEELPALAEEIERIQSEAMAQPPGMDQAMKRLVLMNEHQTALRLLCARWAELDAPGGFAYFSQLKAEGKDDEGRSLLLVEWALRDQATVFQTVQALPDPDRGNHLNYIGTELIREDKEEFWAWFQKARRPLPNRGLGDATWKILTREHFEELSALGVQLALVAAGDNRAAGQPDIQPWELQYLFTLLSTTLAERDPDKALAWAKDQPGKVRDFAIEGVIRTLVKGTPEKLPDYLELLKPPQSGPGSDGVPGSGELVRAALDQMASRDPVKTLNWLKENRSKLPQDSSDAVYSLGGRLGAAIREGRVTPQQASAKPQAASANAPVASKSPLSSPDPQKSKKDNEKLPPGFARREQDLQRLEVTNLGDLRDLLENQASSPWQMMFQTRLWAERDPAGLWRWLRGGGFEKLVGIDASGILFGAWFPKDPAAAITAFHQLGGDRAQRQRAASEMLGLLTTGDDGLRAKLMPFFEELADVNGSSSLPGDTAANAAMLAKMPPGTSRDALLNSTARSWMASNWKASITWAASLTEPLRSRLLATMAGMTFGRGEFVDFPGATLPSHREAGCTEWARKWLNTEAPPEVVSRMGPEFAAALAKDDPAAALEWAQESLLAAADPGHRQSACGAGGQGSRRRPLACGRPAAWRSQTTRRFCGHQQTGRRVRHLADQPGRPLGGH